MPENDKATAVRAATASIDEQLTSKLNPNFSPSVITGKGTNNSARSNAVRIVGLRRLGSCARPWRMKLDNIGAELCLSSRELLCQTAFRRRCLSAIGVLPPLLLQQEWLRIIGSAMSRVEVVEPEGRSCRASNSRG
jgi:hypothetical protein